MNKYSPPPPYEAPPSAPPTYAQAVGGVDPTSPYVPNHSCKFNNWYFFCYKRINILFIYYR